MEIPIKYYKGKFREHMIKNGTWGVFCLSGTSQLRETWDIFLNKYIFNMDDVKLYINDLRRGSKADNYMVQNLTWKGVYSSSSF